jgi:hypothetical protein
MDKIKRILTCSYGSTAEQTDDLQTPKPVDPKVRSSSSSPAVSKSRQPEAVAKSGPEKDESRNLWSLGEDELCKDQKKNEVFEAYLGILATHYGEELAPRGTQKYQTQLRDLLNGKTKEVEANQWKPHTKSLKNILLVKDIISTAASASPPASIACAGVSVVLTVSSGPHYSLLISLAAGSHRGTTRKAIRRFERELWNYC